MIGVLSNRSQIHQSKSSDLPGIDDASRNNYIVWGITDLRGNSISLCLFGSAYDSHWKEVVGSVVMIKNMDAKIGKSKSERTSGYKSRQSPLFSVDKPDQIDKIGTSADFRICAGFKVDGSRCSIAVHREDKYCEYHLGQAMQSMKKKLVGGTR